MLRARLLLLVLMALCGALLSSPAAPLTSTPAAWRVESCSAEFGPTRVRLTLDLAGGAGKPLWQCWYQPSEGAVVIDVKDADASAARVGRVGPDNLIRSWELRRPNFLTAQWVVKLNYPVPLSHVQASLVGDRIVVDVGRAFTEELTLPVTRNVSWHRQEVRTGDDYWLVNELDVKVDKSVSLGVAHASESTKAVEDPVELARRKNALALINGGFFSAGSGPLGLVIDQGRVLVPNVSTRPPRTAVGFTGDGRVLMNRIDVKDSRPRSVDGSADWSQVVCALGGGPRLIRDGKLALTTDEEALGKAGNDITRKAGRTAVARLRNGHLLFVTVSGYRDNHAQGWQLPQLAAWLLGRGAVDAMCLDGGGSVAMVVDGALVSRPPARSGGQRKVANGLMLTDSAPIVLPATVQVTASVHRVKADGTTPVKVVAMVTTAAGKPVADGTPVWFSTTAGVVTPTARTLKGRAVATFVPLRAIGPSTVFAYAGMAVGQDAVAVEGGAPKRLVARVHEVRAAVDPSPATSSPDAPGPRPTPVATAPRTAKVEVMVLDAFDNALPEQDVEIDCGDGTRQRVHTGLDGVGQVSVPISTDVRSLRFGHGSLQPLQMSLP